MDDEEINDEELTLMEVSEDRRLREIGIDPEQDPIDILIQLQARIDAREAKEKQAKKAAAAQRKAARLAELQ